MSVPGEGEGAFICTDNFAEPRFGGKALPLPPENDSGFAEVTLAWPEPLPSDALNESSKVVL